MKTFTEEQIKDGFKKWVIWVKENPDGVIDISSDSEIYAEDAARTLIDFIEEDEE